MTSEAATIHVELPASHQESLAADQTRDLLERFAKTGHAGSFEELVRRYGAMVLSVCQNVLHNRHDAEDATQTTFFVLAEQVRTGRMIHSLGSWLQQVARRASVDLRRSKSRRTHREQERSVPELLDDSAPAGCERSETADLVRQELDRIPAKYRVPIVMHYFGGLEFADVAEQLNIKQPTLGVRLSAAVSCLPNGLRGADLC